MNPLGYSPGDRRHLTAKCTAAVIAAVTLALVLLSAAPAGAFTDFANHPPARYFGDASEFNGAALASGNCDVNDDGYDDVISGAWGWGSTPDLSEGAAYVIFGSAAPAGGNLASGATDSARIDGAADGDGTAFGVGCAGDVNDDGYDDVLIGAYSKKIPGRTEDVTGAAYVVLGDADFDDINLGFLGERGFRIDSSLQDDHLGFFVAGAGDINQDGFDDIAVVANTASTRGRALNGRVSIVPGKEDVANVDLAEPNAALLRIDGAVDGERLGAVSRAGDFNGDGVDDIVLGSYASLSRGPGIEVPGAAYIVDGNARGKLDLANPTDTLTILGPRARERFGISVAALGDVNNDGLDDVLVGADGVSNAATGDREGAAYVIFGKESTSTIDTADMATCDCGYRIKGAVKDDKAGYSVDGIGDVNADNIPDALIGAYAHDPAGKSNAGATYVVFGKTTSTEINLATLTGEQGSRLDGLTASERFGRQVAGVGDVDGDGIDDFAAGADMARRENRASAGETSIVRAGDGLPVISITEPVVGAITTDPTPPLTFTVTAGATCNRTSGDELPTQSNGFHTVTVTCTNAAGSSTQSTSFGVDNNELPVIAITAPLNGGTAKATPAVRFTVNDTSSTTCTPANAASAPGAPFVNGSTQTTTVTCTDAQGNVGTASTSYTVDSVAPVVTITAPTAGQSLNTRKPTFSYTVDDATATCTRISGDPYGTSQADGARTLSVTCTDPALNATTASVAVTIDAAPTVAITAPLTGATVTTLTPNLTFTKDDAAATCDKATATPLDGLAEGLNTVTVTCTDAAGQESTATSTFTVDTTAPTATFTGPLSATNDTTPAVEFSLDDPLAVCNRISGEPTKPLSEGDHTISLVCEDVIGNRSTTTHSVTVDTTPPSVEITSPQDGSTITTPTPNLSFAASDATASCDKTSGTQLSGLTEGSNTVTVTCTDVAGNAATAATTFTVALPVALQPVAPQPTPRTANPAVVKQSKAPKLSSTGRIRLAFSCPADAATCSFTVRFAVGSAKSKSYKVSVLPGARESLTVKLPSKLVKRLRDSGKPTIKLTIIGAEGKRVQNLRVRA